MTHSQADIERYVRKRTNVPTAGERDRAIENLTRYRQTDSAESTGYPRGMQWPPGFQAGDTTSTTATASGQSNALYLGPAPDDITVVTVRMNVIVGLSTTTWAELAICTSLEAPFGPADLILEGFTGVGSTFNSTGVKDTEIAVTISKGAHCWLVWGSSAVTPFTVRGGIGDPLSTGRHQFLGATQPSTMASPTTFSVTANATVAAWISYIW